MSIFLWSHLFHNLQIGTYALRSEFQECFAVMSFSLQHSTAPKIQIAVQVHGAGTCNSCRIGAFGAGLQGTCSVPLSLLSIGFIFKRLNIMYWNIDELSGLMNNFSMALTFVTM